jgi:hypothetical protein
MPIRALDRVGLSIFISRYASFRRPVHGFFASRKVGLRIQRLIRAFASAPALYSKVQILSNWLTLTGVAVEKGTKAVISVNFSAYGKRRFNNLRANFVREIPRKEFFNSHSRFHQLPRSSRLVQTPVGVEKVPQQNVFCSASMPLSAFFSPFD